MRVLFSTILKNKDLTKNELIKKLQNADNEDMRTARGIFLEKSKSFSIENCGKHKDVVGKHGCKNVDSDSYYGCNCWEPIKEKEIKVL